MIRCVLSAGVISALCATLSAEPTSTVVSDGASVESPLSDQLADVFNPLQKGVTSSTFGLFTILSRETLLRLPCMWLRYC